MKQLLLVAVHFIVLTASAQTLGIPEISDNESAANAQLISSTAKISANIYPNADVDWYKFTATAGDKIYAAVMTAHSTSNNDSRLILYASDGTTIIETDEDDGLFTATSSVIAGATIASTGTYYLRVVSANTTSNIRGYDLYFKIQSGTAVAETEPNDNAATANLLPISGWVSGARNPALATEQDWYSITLAAGETIFIALDMDPERDNVQWNGRINFGMVGDAANTLLLVDDLTTASAANPSGEFLVYTVKDAGTYYVMVDASSAAVGGPTATYTLSATKFAAATGYVNYPSADPGLPKAIGPGAGVITSTLTIPDNKRIKDISIRINLNHALMNDLDVNLTAPDGSVTALFNDIGSTAIGGQTNMDLYLNDNNAIPFSFVIVKPVGLQTELNYPLYIYKGAQAQGTWTLTIYDDLANTSGGTINSWSIDILEDVQPNITGATVITYETFEATNGGFTHSGTLDEWEWGQPATVATTTSSPVAAFNTANSGTKCWKTDLDNTYDNGANADLVSPIYDLTTYTSGTILLSWAMKLQMESANFDHVRITIVEEGNPANTKILYDWLGATQTATTGSPVVNIPISTPWGVYWVDISAFAGKQVRFIVHIDTDTSVILGGVAIDDIRIYSLNTVLPLRITSFAVKPKDCTALLSWTTEDEQQVSHFEIQQSIDGINFTTLQSIASKGTGNHQYQLSSNPVQKQLYYRLVAVDINGRKTISPIQQLQLTNCSLPGKIKVYPVPATMEQAITLSTELEQKITYRLLDMSGKQLQSGSFIRSTQLRIGSSGTYLVECSAAGFKETQLVVVQ